MILKIEDLEMRFGDNLLFERVNLQIKEGEKIVLIGPNGSGKTTFLKILNGEIDQSGGKIFFYGRRMGTLSQFRIDKDRTLYEEGLSAFDRAFYYYEKALENAIKSDIDGYELALSNAESLDVYSAEKRVREMLKGIGFSEGDFDRRISTLSAGEITKLEIAKLMIMDPDLMILDEPGNYLDVYGMEFLNDTIPELKGAVIIATHDRNIMERVPDKIWEIDFGTIRSYDGKYGDFLLQKENFLKTIENKTKVLDKKINETQKAIRRYREWGRDKAIKQAKSKEKFVEKLLEERKDFEFEKRKTFKQLRFQTKGVSEDVILKVDNLDVFAGEKYIGNFSFEIHNGQKVALLGKNGIGKTSLLKSLMSKKAALSWGPNTRVAFVDTVGADRSEKQIIEDIWEVVPLWKDFEVRKYLGRFGFEGDDAFKEISSLSGGEFVRYQLAKALINDPNFLILDEPTNHLDLYMIESLEDTLSKYAGAILFTTHDLKFAEHIADLYFILDAQGLHGFENYEMTEDFLRSAFNNVKVISTSNEDFEKKRRIKNRIKKLEIEIANREERLNILNERIRDLESQMSNCNDHYKLVEILKDKEKVEKEAEEIIKQMYEFEEEKRVLEEES
ncbi:ABC-F family ATP-binding cassette domain-containing protein [Athalassotoga saccharophila]|uniref:ABC-F family ATP-binding cassette domain-containing protein n=1 Tax=Athalassotoga saccharophila TaxID=1441386 RepID=UPI001379CB10|nr:ABC-F family ATP-binding cassette domain-containing protein [Athalassotoga saccharophila]BBJ27881.1 putative ABC transporter ATP-binding protein YheS [Athalassotoga saccharophila]